MVTCLSAKKPQVANGLPKAQRFTALHINQDRTNITKSRHIPFTAPSNFSISQSQSVVAKTLVSDNDLMWLNPV